MRHLARTAILMMALATIVTAPAMAADTASVPLPQFGDAYSKLVAQAEGGDKATDYRALRFAWLEGPAHKQRGPLRGLQQELMKAAAANDNASVRDAAVKVLAVNYVDLTAQAYLATACQRLGDTVCADRHHAITTGLLASITDHGDGKTPETAWTVADIGEEYFIITTLGAKASMQHLIHKEGKAYDQMDVTANGQPHTLYFEITEMFAKELD